MNKAQAIQCIENLIKKGDDVLSTQQTFPELQKMLKREGIIEVIYG